MIRSTARILFLRKNAFNIRSSCVRFLRSGNKKPTSETSEIQAEKDSMKESPFHSFPTQRFDHFLVLDLEATCDETPMNTPQEIIEFPIHKVNAKSLQVESVFHTYVYPEKLRDLPPFCTKLTGITQQMLGGQPNFKEVMKMADDWMHYEGLFESRFIFVTSGAWDIQQMLWEQCMREEIQIPKYFSPYININKSFATATGKWPKHGNRIRAMARMLGIHDDEPMHSGTVDCENIILILQQLILQYDFVFKQNSKLTHLDWHT